MNPNYVVFYTLFGLGYNGFKTSYKHFETMEEALKFVKHKQINEGSYVIYKKVNFDERKEEVKNE